MLTSDRVTLRPIREGDLPTLHANLIDPQTWHQTNDEPLWPMPFATYQELYAKLSSEEQAVFAIEAEGKLAGRCALFSLDDLARNADIGISLGAQFRGKGYGREVLGLLLDYAFNKRNLHRVQLEVLADNVAALAAYNACGFVDEGRLREHAYVAGEYVDLVVMSVLRTEWLAAQGAR